MQFGAAAVKNWKELINCYLNEAQMKNAKGGNEHTFIHSYIYKYIYTRQYSHTFV